VYVLVSVFMSLRKLDLSLCYDLMTSHECVQDDGARLGREELPSVPDIPGGGGGGERGRDVSDVKAAGANHRER